MRPSIRTILAGLAATLSCQQLAAQGDGVHGTMLPSNHAIIITVSEYQRSPLPGVLTDRKLANELAQRFGVPPQNIVNLSEQQVTREGLRQALAGMNQVILPGDRLYVYFSGHGARFLSKATGQCTESIVMQDMHVVTNAEFTAMLKPLSTKTDKTIVILDSCHSGGVANAAASRALGSQRPKFSAEATSPECSVPVNLGSFAQSRGLDFGTTDNNLVILAAARNNEVAWDTSKGGALTYNFEQCLGGSAHDSDHSGSLSMQELTACVQSRLDKTQEESARQHATLAGNVQLVPAFNATSAAGAGGAALPGGHAPSAPPSGAPSAPVTPISSAPAADVAATLNDIFQQRDDRWEVRVMAPSQVKIGSNLSLTVESRRAGYVYVFYQGTQPGSFYLLFPNQLDANNAIAAGETMQLPRAEWNVTALGPRGTDHLLVLVTATVRDFSRLALPAEYVSAAGPFEKIQPSLGAAEQISRIATLSEAAGKAACNGSGTGRDLGVAATCSNAFGAGSVSVVETE
jgi:hypothetical protein